MALAASAALFAQSNGGSPVRPPNVADVGKIVRASVAATERNFETRDHYAYLVFDEDRRVDSSGRVKSKDVDVTRIILINGAPFEQWVQHNGQPLSAGERKKQEEQIGKLKRETPEQQAARLSKEREYRSLLWDVPNAFDFQLLGEEVVNGRPAYVLQGTPRPGYQGHSKYAKILSKVEGKFWVDKQDFGCIRADGHVIETISFGWFLARVQKGSHLMMEQSRVDGIWMPKRIEVQADATILLVKAYDVFWTVSYSDYQRFPRLAAEDRNGRPRIGLVAPLWLASLLDKIGGCEPPCSVLP